MIRKLVDFALNNQYVVLAIGLLLLGWGRCRFTTCPSRPIRTSPITT